MDELEQILGNPAIEEAATGVALARVLAERPGRKLAVNVAYVCHVKDGRIPELWKIPADQAAGDAFWS